MATQCLALFEARASLRSCSATSDATAFPMLRSRSSFVAREAPLHPIKSFIFSIYKTSPEGRESPAEFAPADDSPVTPMIPSYTQNPGGGIFPTPSSREIWGQDRPVWPRPANCPFGQRTDVLISARRRTHQFLQQLLPLLPSAPFYNSFIFPSYACYHLVSLSCHNVSDSL